MPRTEGDSRSAPELIAKVAPLMAVMIIVIICGVGWLIWRNRKLRHERRHYTPKKPRKKRGN